jgi:S1-C subfamily serine protease
MSQLPDWTVPAGAQPKPEDYEFDLDRALAAVVAIRSIVPSDAFSAETLGTERAGNGVLVRDGVVLTIGYLITEAEQIWITFSDGRVAPGHVLGFDQETGFGLVQALARVDIEPIEMGDSSALQVGERVVVAGAGGRHHSIAARVAARQEFAGYWEYVLDEAIFTVPAHPNWGGTALIGSQGELLGIGSLQLEQPRANGTEHLNMSVPIDLIKPIFDDLVTLGRRNQPPRPWLGLYATEVNDRVVVVGMSSRGPARKADLRTGDVLLAVGGTQVSDLAGLFRRIWAQGHAGVDVPLTVYRDGKTFELRVPSADRRHFLKAPRLH